MKHLFHSFLAAALALLALAGLLAGLDGHAQAATLTTLYVAPGGDDGNACTAPASPCRSLQAAVDRAAAFDEVRVATGVYTGLQARAGVTQLVYISRSLGLRGGYSPDFTAHDPLSYPTTLDAQGLGRAVYITGPVSVTLDDLVVTHGDATALGGKGGGVWLRYATATISGCTIISNTANSTGAGYGGGFYASNARLNVLGSTVAHNLGSWSAAADGGGGHTTDSQVELRDSVFRENVGSQTALGHGGGATLRGAGQHVTISNCEFVSNTATAANSPGYGGALRIIASATLMGNRFLGNRASRSGAGYGGGASIGGALTLTMTNNYFSNNGAGSSSSEGGGLWLLGGSRRELTGNTFLSNTASFDGSGNGGGVYASGVLTLTLTDNHFAGNTASLDDSGNGGGLRLSGGSQGQLTGNTFLSNTASLEGNGNGGGVYASSVPTLTLTNNHFKGNTGGLVGAGGGLRLSGTSNGLLADNTFVHNTASLNGMGWGGGMSVSSVPTLTLTGNTFLSNTATIDGYGYGGGVYASSVLTLTLTNNHLTGNTASRSGYGVGGGLNLGSSPNCVLTGNRFTDNIASLGTEGYGGAAFINASTGTLNANILQHNRAGTLGSGWGGALRANRCTLTLDANRFLSNTASLSATSNSQGGAALLESGAFTFTNNLFAANQAHLSGAGLNVTGLPGYPVQARLLHNTFADHPGDALRLGNYASVALTNTIMAGNTSAFHLSTCTTCTLSADHTLFWNSPTPFSGTHPLSGDPAFVDPAAWDYHLGPTSAALDAGIDAGLSHDFDGQPRPLGPAPDLGADEFVPYAATLTPPTRQARAYPSQGLVYTHTLHNSGSLSTTFLLTLTSSRGWTHLAGPASFSLAPGASVLLTLTTQVPFTATPGITDVATLTAGAAVFPSARAWAIDTTTVETRIYLPLVVRGN